MIKFKQGASDRLHRLKRIQFWSIAMGVIAAVSVSNAGFALAEESAAARGKGIFGKMNCAACHQVHGVGAMVGPDLSYVGDKRDKKWLLAHFKDPKSLSPNSIMPPVTLPEPELADLTSYMLSLKKESK